MLRTPVSRNSFYILGYNSASFTAYTGGLYRSEITSEKYFLDFKIRFNLNPENGKRVCTKRGVSFEILVSNDF